MSPLRVLALAAVTVVLALGMSAPAYPVDDDDERSSVGQFDATITRIFAEEKMIQVRLDRLDDNLLDRAKRFLRMRTLEVGDLVYVRVLGAIQGLEKHGGNEFKNLEEGLKLRVKHTGAVEVASPKSVRDAGGPDRVDAFDAEIIDAYPDR